MAEAGRGLDAAAGDAVADPAFAQCTVAVGDVVGLVGVELRGFAPTRAVPGPDLGDALDERLQCLTVMQVRGRDAQGEGQAVPIGEDVDLAARLAAIDRVWAGQRSPFLARKLAASTIARDQSMSPQPIGHKALGELIHSRVISHPWRSNRDAFRDCISAAALSLVPRRILRIRPSPVIRGSHSHPGGHE
jgi:hypothetical protein